MDGLHCAFIGRVGQDAELKWTQNGTPLVNVSVLVQDSKAADGQGQWVRVGRFGDEAEDLAEQLVKGVDVYVERPAEVEHLAGRRRDTAKRPERDSVEARTGRADRPACASHSCGPAR